MHTARLLTVSPSKGGVSALGKCLLRGGCLVGIPACTEADRPWIEFLTHATGNIALPQTWFAGGNKVLRLIEINRNLYFTQNWHCKIPQQFPNSFNCLKKQIFLIKILNEINFFSNYNLYSKLIENVIFPENLCIWFIDIHNALLLVYWTA